jgi:hypothetical protein
MRASGPACRISRLHGSETLGVLGCARLDDRSEGTRKEKLTDQAAEKRLRWSDGNRQSTRRPSARPQRGEPGRIDRQEADTHGRCAASLAGTMVKHYEPTDTFTLSPVVEASQHGADRVRERFHRRRRLLMGGRRLGLGAPTRVGAGSDREHEPLSSVIAGRC